MKSALKKMMSGDYKWFWLIGILAVILRLSWLTALPVFADEAIYIRWAQLIIDEPWRYAFFPLNDGKTPLFIWFLTPFQLLLNDPLAAGRLVSVLSTPLQLWLLWKISQVYKLDRLQTKFVLLLAAVLPFWHFHARLALMDAWLSVWLTWVWLSFITLERQKKSLAWISVSTGLSLWTKLSASLFLPGLLLAGWLFKARSQRWQFVRWAVLGLIGGGLLFFSLKLVPVFHQLFSRGSDFLFTFNQLLAGEWRQIPARFGSQLLVLGSYLTPLVLLSPVLGIKTRLQKVHLTHLVLVLPSLIALAVLGKVVYPRYLLPLAPVFTLSAGIILGSAWHKVSTMPLGWRQFLASFGLTSVLASILVPSIILIVSSWWWPNQLQIPNSDRVQYLSEWSGGQGIRETFHMIKTQSSMGTVAVATEGFFGTLPDALLMYLHSDPTDGILIEGIGQPVSEIPSQFKQSAQAYQYQWLVVNSHRNRLNLDSRYRLAEFCRVEAAPCLELWDISSLIQ